MSQGSGSICLNLYLADFLVIPMLSQTSLYPHILRRTSLTTLREPPCPSFKATSSFLIFAYAPLNHLHTQLFINSLPLEWGFYSHVPLNTNPPLLRNTVEAQWKLNEKYNLRAFHGLHRVQHTGMCADWWCSYLPIDFRYPCLPVCLVLTPCLSSAENSPSWSTVNTTDEQLIYKGPWTLSSFYCDSKLRKALKILLWNGPSCQVWLPRGWGIVRFFFRSYASWSTFLLHMVGHFMVNM